MKPLIGIITVALIISMLECLLWHDCATWFAMILHSMLVLGGFYWIGGKK